MPDESIISQNTPISSHRFCKPESKSSFKRLESCQDSNMSTIGIDTNGNTVGQGMYNGFLWLKDGPNIDEVDFENPDERRQLAEYFSTKVFAHTPIPNHPRPEVNPCQLPGPQPTNNNCSDLAEVFNHCQRHSKCLATYCLRWNRHLKKIACRFGFLQPPVESPII